MFVFTVLTVKNHTAKLSFTVTGTNALSCWQKQTKKWRKIGRRQHSLKMPTFYDIL